MVKRFPSNAGAVGLLPGQGAKSAYALCAPHDPPPEKKEKEQHPTPYKQKNKAESTLTNSIKTLKMAHIKKNLKQKEQKSLLSFVEVK